MTKKSWPWVGAGVFLLAVATIGRELVRSGTVAEGLLSHWYTQAGFGAVVLAVVGVGLYLMNRGYERD